MMKIPPSEVTVPPTDDDAATEGPDLSNNNSLSTGPDNDIDHVSLNESSQRSIAAYL